MAKRAWFTPKQYGIGYSPSSWEGWLATAAFVLILVGGIKAIQHYGDVPPGPWRAILPLAWVAINTGVFLWIAGSKTEGEMRWRWGGRD